MKDMLVRLVGLPHSRAVESELEKNHAIIIRRPLAPEKHLVAHWVGQHFSAYWESEVEVAFSRQPVSCFIAQRGQDILGFACYECTARNFFGPTGTLEAERGKGIGKALLLKSLEALRELGYGYAIIGGVGPEAFYQKVVGARVIEGSEVSVYEHLIRKKP